MLSNLFNSNILDGFSSIKRLSTKMLIAKDVTKEFILLIKKRHTFGYVQKDVRINYSDIACFYRISVITRSRELTVTYRFLA